MNTRPPTLLAILVSAFLTTAAMAGSECEETRIDAPQAPVAAKVEPPPVKARRAPVPAAPRRGNCNRPYALVQCAV